MKPGYKQTEVGVIPEEWEVKTFERLFNFSGGYSASRDQLSSEGHCYLHYGDIHGATKTTVDVRADYQNIPKLNIPLKRVASKSLLEDGDVVFVDASEDDEGTSRHVVVVNKDKKPFISGLHTIVAKSKTDELVHEYRRYCFQTATIRQQFLFYAVGTKVSGISKTNIAKLKLPVPTPPEQRAIATALSDVDGLLGGLDRLIAKKRDLKQAAMQQLLTGQTRLPGFLGEWEVKRLDALADIRSGGTPSTGEPRFWDGNIPWCTPTDITALNGHKYLGETARMITQIGLKASSAEMIPAQSVVMTSRATIGECAINVVPVSTNQGFKNFVPFETTDVDFLYYLLGTQKKGFISLCGGSTFLEIGKTQLAAYEVRLPATKVEQTAIASVLTEMDGELAVLEQRREKTRALKQAMMQELLTGKTRLV
jgi:type I restriction enzyme S subunit